ncbi:kinesin-like protein KIF16B [Glandiceps talaboti]
MASVKVAVRVRPINEREINLQSPCILQMEGKKTSITNLKIAGSGSGDTGRERVKTFIYDYSYWSYNSQDPHFVSQQQVFEDLGTEVLKNAFEGYNACVFAYGQTGSGKSYTMMGNKPDAIGLIPRICEALYNHIEGDKSEGTSYRTEVSYLEIYNERVSDLLKSRRHNLRVREHPRDGPYVQNLSKHLVSDYHDIETLMDRGNIHRTTASTNMNDTSSRSHAIFTINFTQARFYNDLPSETTSKVHLVDLAGSERADATGATGQRLKEGANINKSLVTLGNVISALADISSSPGHLGGKKKQSFIPYRDSVLTWLLKDSLGGNAKTMMIATVSPADVNYGETLSTLRYANRAKNIINQPEVNEDRNVKLIRELRSEISKLRQMLAGDLASVKFPKREAEMVDRLHENEARVKVLTEEWEHKWKETKKIMKEQTLALRREGIGVVLDSELPHLIGITDDPLSTGLKLYHLKEGLTSVGRDDAEIKPDIALWALDIEKEHCMFKNANGVVNLIPLKKAPCSINGQAIMEATSLTQGCVVLLGKTHMFRFNHPAEAARLRMERKSKSMTDLAQSTENLLSIFNSPGMEIEKIQKEEWERLDEKRRHIEELEEKHRQAEESRLKEQELREYALKDQTHQLEQLRHDSEQAKQEAQREQRKIIKEQERLKRQSADFLKQMEDYQKQMEDYLEEKEKFEEEKLHEKEEIEKERQNFEQEREQERQKFEEEKKEMRIKIDQEMERLMEIEKEQKNTAEKAKQSILTEQLRLEDDRKQEKMKLEAAMRRLEGQEERMKEKAKEAELDITKRLGILQQERDKELEMIEAERRRLEELQLEQEAAKHNTLDGENSTIEKLKEDSEKLVQAQEEVTRLEQNHFLQIKEMEEEIKNKRLDFEKEVRQERDDLEKEWVALNEKEVKLKQILELGQYETEEERQDIEKELQEVEDETKRLQLKEENINLREEENRKMIEAELTALEEKKLQDQELIKEKQNTVREMETKNLISIQREISEKNRILSDRKNKIEEDENLLKELKSKHASAISNAMEEKRVLDEERLHLEDLDKQQTIKSQQALAEIDRRKYMLDKETEKEMEKIEEKRKELEQQQEEMTASMKIEQAARKKQLSRKAVSVSAIEDLDYLAKAAEEKDMENKKKLQEEEGQNLEHRLRSVQDLEEQTKKAERELLRKRQEFEIQRTKEIERIKLEKYKLKEMEDQERVKELIEDEVKKRLFEDKVQREKVLLSEKEREKLEREREIQQLKRAHRRELDQLKKKFSSGQSSTGSKSNPYGGLKNRDGIPGAASQPQRKLSEPNLYTKPLTEHRRPVENPIVINIPRYMLRGHGRDSHHVFEVQVSVLDNTWVVYRRYRQFRELHELMRQLYPEVGALEFPPKRLFGNKSERVVSKRRGQLENYMRCFIHVCLRLRNCPLSPGEGRILSKHTLCEFAPFFKKGAFETTKYGTS